MDLDRSSLPPNWAVAKLGDVGEVRYGLGQPPEQSPDGVPMIRATNVKRGRISADGLIRIRRDAIPESRNAFLKTGDIVVVRSGAYTGDVAMITKEWAGSVAGYDLVVSPTKQVDPEFCSFHLLGNDVQAYFHTQSARSAQPHLNRHQLESTEIPLPPLCEQRKIAQVLGLIQRAMKHQERLIALTTELKKAALHQLFTKGVRGEPQQQTEIGLTPESWTATTLGALASKPDGFLQTGPFGSQLHKHEYLTEGVGVVNPTHLGGNQINHDDVPRVSPETAARLDRHRLEIGDILFARRGEIGRHGMVTKDEEGWLCGTGCFLARVRRKDIDNRFLSYLCSTQGVMAWLNSHAAGAIMPNLNNTVLRSMPLQYPPRKEQKEIADCLDAIERKLAVHKSRHNALTDLFRTLLHHLMAAQVRLHNVDLSELDN